MSRFTFLLLLSCLSFPANAEKACSYRSYSWNTVSKSIGKVEQVEKKYSELDEFERDRYTGCSVCDQDQRMVFLPGLKPFRACYIFANRLETVLLKLIDQGEVINQVVGYRVGKTRGEVDSEGYRSGFSNHSYGIAIDINKEANGLYDNCLTFNADCRLIRGGHWHSNNRASLQAEGAVVLEMKRFGLKWGGQIAGKQKDFMHFSPSGY